MIVTLVTAGLLGSMASGCLGLIGTERAVVRRRFAPRGVPRQRSTHPRLERALDRCAIDVAPERAVLFAAVGVGSVATVGLFVGGVGLAAVTLLGCGVGGVVGYAMLRHRRDQRIEAELPDALEELARSLRAGHSLRQALIDVGPRVGPSVARDLATVGAVLEAGASVSGALLRWDAHRRLPGVGLAVSALVLATDAGGAQARALDGVATTLRDRLEMGREVQALAAQASTSGIVVALLPVGFLALTVSADPATATFLFSTPLGLGCLVGGLALDAAAAWWMHRIAREIR